MVDEKSASVQFIKKINLTGAETEVCDECAAKPICKLRDNLQKAKIPNRETHIKQCGFEI